jgi:hypothetical protein
MTSEVIDRSAVRGATVALGHDFATIADDGRLRTVVGLLEQPAAAAA